VDGLDLDPAETVDPNAGEPWFGIPVVAKSVACRTTPMVCVYSSDEAREREAKSRLSHIKWWTLFRRLNGPRVKPEPTFWEKLGWVNR